MVNSAPSYLVKFNLLKFWLVKICKRNRFLRPLLLKKYESSPWWGLAAFIVRENSNYQFDMLNQISLIIEENGFSVIDYKKFDDFEKESITQSTRGGNWDHNFPFGIIVAFDINPVKVSKKEVIRQWPELDNQNLAIKSKIRIDINKLVPEEHYSNYIHVSDNSFKAWNYINFCSQDFGKSITDSLEKFKRSK